MQESMHVFIEAGLHPLLGKPGTLHLLEMGFGTGLNALLTLRHTAGPGRPVHYHALERYPLTVAEYSGLDYPNLPGNELPGTDIRSLHEVPWETDVPLGQGFTLHKSAASVLEFTPLHPYDLVYYDAFAPGAQPELWTVPVFTALFAMMTPGGKLVTYCSKGDVRRAMMASGFMVEKLPGPKGKREMVRATKPAP